MTYIKNPTFQLIKVLTIASDGAGEIEILQLFIQLVQVINIWYNDYSGETECLLYVTI